MSKVPLFYDDTTSRRRMYPLGSAEFSALLDDPGHHDVRAIYDYWASKCNGQAAPRRPDIEPADIRSLLPNLMLLDVVRQADLDFRYRLLGTKVTSVDGSDMTGMLLSETMPETGRVTSRLLWEQYRRAADGEVSLRFDTQQWNLDDSRPKIDYVIMLFPLRLEGEAIEMIMSYTHYYYGPDGSL